MRTSKRFLIACILLLVNTLIYSQNAETVTITDNSAVYPITRKWNFSIIDTNYHEIKNIDYSNWYLISPQGAWILSLPEAANYYSTAWYQIPIKFNKDFTSEVGLSIPLTFAKCSIYLNESLIYKSEKSYGSPPQVIMIDKNIITEGINTLSIKMDTFSGWGGLSAEFISIGNYEEAKKIWIIYLIKNSAISFVSLFLSLYFVIMYFYRRKEKYNLYFAGFSLSVSLFILGYYGLSYYLIDTAWIYWVLTFVAGINMYLFPILFIHSFYNIRLRIGAKIFTGFYSFLTLFVIVEYLITGQIFFFNKYLYNFFNLSYILVVFYLLIISIKSYKLNFNYSRTMLVGVILLTVSFVYSMLCFSNIIVKTPLIGEGFFLMVIAFSIVLGKRFAETHSSLEREYALNVELSNSLEVKVEERTKELAEKNHNIMESIKYASLIQNSILPSEGQLEEIFADHYIYWQPKDIVGGDFYWVLEKDNGFIAAVIDCTGHGVPGALLTMTAKSLLERIVTHINDDDPGTILTQLNKLLKRVLSQDNPYEIKDDGLDMGMVIYNRSEQTMLFSGSKFRLHTEKSGEIVEYKGDKQGIGYKRSKYTYNYSTKGITISKGMTFHMTTDGYPEQSGGINGYSFGWANYKKALINLENRSLKEQLEHMKSALKSFQRDYSQRDDITLMGFRLKD